MKNSILVCFIAMAVVSCSSDISPQKEGVAAQIHRNEFNEVSITVTQAPKGEADHVLFRLQCREMARDRLFPMDVARRAGLGELSEIYPAELAEERDRAVIALGLRHSAFRKLERVQNHYPLEYSHLKACADGVNEYLKELVEKGTSDPSSPERRWLDYYRDKSRTNNSEYVPREWNVVDIIATFQNITFYLSSNVQAKLSLGELGFRELSRNLTWSDRVKLTLGTRREDPEKMPDQVRKLLDLRPIYPTFIMDADPDQNPFKERSAAAKANVKDPAIRESYARAKAGAGTKAAFSFRYDCKEIGFPVPECPKNRGMSIGSNSWVLGPSMTGDGTVRVMNDTHLQLSYPMNLYPVVLNSKPAADPNNPDEGFKGRGMQIPGVPGWLIGHNEFAAWGLTNHGADVDEFRLEKVTDDGKSVIFFEGGRRKDIPIQSDTVILNRRQADGSVKKIPVVYRWTAHHGPVVSDGIPILNSILEGAARHYGAKSMVATYAWTGHEATWTELGGRKGRGTETVAQLRLDRVRNFEEFKSAIQNISGGAQNIVYGDVEGNIGYYTYGLFPVRKYADRWAPLYPTLGQGKFEWEPHYRTTIPELYNPPSGKIVTANNDAFGLSASAPDADYQGIFNTGARSYRINELLDQNRGRLDENVNAQIQFDHVDRTVTAFTKLLYRRGYNLPLDKSSAEYQLFDTLVKFDGNMDRRANAPVLVDSWLKQLQDVFIENYFAPEVQPAAQRFKQKVELTTTVYHALDEGDETFVHKILNESLSRAVEEIENYGLRDYEWGEVHKLGLWNPLEGIAKLAVTFNLPRDGYLETIDVAAPTVGPNFRSISTLRKGSPIEVLISLPGGNFDVRERTSIYTEFARWIGGGYRMFKSFEE